MNGVPSFKHPLDSHEGRIERAVWTLQDGERLKIQVADTIGFLKRKGCTDEEITEALNQASSGELVRSALK
jgi:hypothetical protein